MLHCFLLSHSSKTVTKRLSPTSDLLLDLRLNMSNLLIRCTIGQFSIDNISKYIRLTFLMVYGNYE